MKPTASPTFCARPWTTLVIDQRGQVEPCTWAYDQPVGNIKTQSIQSTITGAELTQMRQQMSQGIWPSRCGKCQQLEANTGSSPRLWEKHVATAEQLAQIDQDPDHFELLHLNIAWTSLCNLTCTYCNPHTSTAWQAALHIPIKLETTDTSGLVDLARASPNIRSLTLGGGEPLLQRGLLEFLTAFGRRDIGVTVTTNLIMDLDRNAIYQELKHWPHVCWMISFDTVDPAQFEYIRRGATWAQFRNNIDQLQQAGVHVVAHPAYSVYSALHIEQYYEFCTALGLEIFWCEVYHPYTLATRKLPAHLRTRASEAIDRVIQRWGHRRDLAIDTLRTYQQQLGRPLDLIDQSDSIVEFHLKQEQALKPAAHRFEDLWPDLCV